MLIADIRNHLQTNFVVHHEFVALCAGNLEASNLLSYLFWWTDYTERNKPERNGWTFQTAMDLQQALSLSRRGYEKARKRLLELGILQYRRAGVFGRMHWRLNKEKLLELIYLLKGETPPEWASDYQYDVDNYQLPKFIPLEQWHEFLKMRFEQKGRKLGLSIKRKLLKRLIKFHSDGLDLSLIMERTIAAGWADFYPVEPQKFMPQAQPQPSIEEVLKEVQAEREREIRPPPDKNSKQAKSALENMMKILKKTSSKH